MVPVGGVELLSALIGGLLTLIGVIGAQIYEHQKRTDNLRQALKTEVELSNEVLEPLMLARRIDRETRESYDSECELLTSGIIDDIDFDRYENINEEFLRDFRSQHPFQLVVCSARRIHEVNRSRVYESNVDQIGKLDSTAAEVLIRFYGSLDTIEEDLEIINIHAETLATGGDDNPIIVRDFLNRVCKTYDLQQSTLKLLSNQ